MASNSESPILVNIPIYIQALPAEGRARNVRLIPLQFLFYLTCIDDSVISWPPYECFTSTVTVSASNLRGTL